MDAFLTKRLQVDELMGILNGSVPGQHGNSLGTARTAKPLPGGKLITGKGLMVEMPGSDDWSGLKNRWMGIFEDYADSLGKSVACGDPEAARKTAHKLVGHLRLIKADYLADILIDLMTAAEAGDRMGMEKEHVEFDTCLKQFSREFRDL
jgi:hypothetical protein